MGKGLFISIEGLDGSGKTTIQSFIHDWLKELISNNKIDFHDVIKTREPGGKDSSFCENLRSLIFNNNLDNKTEILLYAASRIEHVKNVILPHIETNDIVISDRFIDSSLVYQGFKNNISIDEIFNINNWGINNKIPDITIYLDINPEKARTRALERSTINKYDKKPLEYYKDIKDGFDFIANKYSNRFIVIDANQSENQIKEDIKSKIWEKLIKMNAILQ